MVRGTNIRVYQLLGVLIAVLIQTLPGYADGSKSTIFNSKHDFSVGSSATIRSGAEQGTCVFCHSPHAANPSVPLWNHTQSSVTNYGVYSSTTLKAEVGLPTASDSSKLCLSCHDGTVALGDTINNGVIDFLQGSNYMLPASSASNLNGTVGFPDDHPFTFNPVTGVEIQNPAVGDPVKLDAMGRVQCASCHDPHNEFIDPVVGKFLVKGNTASALCLTCHNKIGWESASHKLPSDPTDDARYTAAQGAHTGYDGVSNNGCESCHRPHTASFGQRLLKYTEENVCFQCHNGSVANTSRNIQDAFWTKTYRHPVLTTPSVHDASEGASSAAFPVPETSAGAARHSECADCHNPHAANAMPASSPAVEGVNLDVSGITSSGAEIGAAQNQYEICFKCHADSANKPQYFDTGTAGIGFGREPHRVTESGNPNRNNKRLEFSSAVSWHPVINARGLAAGSTGEVPSLRPYMMDAGGQAMLDKPLSPASTIYCTDCHNNDTGRNLGSGMDAAGPHGSNQPHLLERSYAYNYPPAVAGGLFSSIPYSSGAYGICAKCHDLDNSILLDQSFKGHRSHVEGVGASCSVCHDAHGISAGNVVNNSHLIDFDTSIAGPSSSGDLRYEDTGFGGGRCYLQCHGVDHDPMEYMP